MIFHLSFSAHNPHKVAHVLAELMGGTVQPFPVVPEAWIAFANDSQGTAIEVYPLTTTLQRGAQGRPVEFNIVPHGTYSRSVHFALKTPLTCDEVLRIGEREGWQTVSCSRGGYFHVVELWVENEFLIEAITPDKQEEAIAFHNDQAWAKAIGGNPSA